MAKKVVDFNVDIKKCARCGGDHTNRKCYELTNSPTKKYDYWTMCPKLKEPILITFKRKW